MVKIFMLISDSSRASPLRGEEWSPDEKASNWQLNVADPPKEPVKRRTSGISSRLSKSSDFNWNAAEDFSPELPAISKPGLDAVWKASSNSPSKETASWLDDVLKSANQSSAGSDVGLEDNEWKVPSPESERRQPS